MSTKAKRPALGVDDPAARALEHLEDYGCEAWHEGHACEWQMRCDEPRCTRAVTCGTPTPEGYRSTCSEHKPGGTPRA